MATVCLFVDPGKLHEFIYKNILRDRGIPLFVCYIDWDRELCHTIQEILRDEIKATLNSLCAVQKTTECRHYIVMTYYFIL